MNNIVHTLIVEAVDSDMNAQSNATATSVADAASTNRLMVQRDGAFATGELTNTTADQLIKLSAATTMSDGTVSVMSSSEFKLGDIIASSYTQPNASSAGNSTINYANADKVGGQFFVRLERKSGINISDTETYSGETLTQLKSEFDAAKAANRTEFGNVSMAESGNLLTVTVAAKDSDSEVYLSANKGAAINLTPVTDKVGTLSIAKKLEKNGFISMGAYNQYKFPIVIPESSTAAGQDYGIYTVELRKKVGGRFVYETIKVLIRDDEAVPSKTALALNNLLSLTAADTTAPTALTSVTFVTAADDDTAITSGSINSATAFFVQAVGAEVGTTLTLTITSSGSEDDISMTFPVAQGTDIYSFANADAADYAQSVTLTLGGTLTDSSGNVSSAATTGDTLSITA